MGSSLFAASAMGLVGLEAPVMPGVQAELGCSIHSPAVSCTGKDKV